MAQQDPERRGRVLGKTLAELMESSAAMPEPAVFRSLRYHRTALNNIKWCGPGGNVRVLREPLPRESFTHDDHGRLLHREKHGTQYVLHRCRPGCGCPTPEE